MHSFVLWKRCKLTRAILLLEKSVLGTMCTAIVMSHMWRSIVLNLPQD
jgi:hypothetical protein